MDVRIIRWVFKNVHGPHPQRSQIGEGNQRRARRRYLFYSSESDILPTFKNIRIIPESSCMLVPRLCQSSHPQSKPLLTFFSRHRLVLPLLELHTTKSCVAWFVRKLLAFMRLCALVVCSFLLSVTLYGYAIVYPLICCWWTLRLFPVLFGLFWINLLGTFLWHMLSFLLNCRIIG